MVKAHAADTESDRCFQNALCNSPSIRQQYKKGRGTTSACEITVTVSLSVTKQYNYQDSVNSLWASKQRIITMKKLIPTLMQVYLSLHNEVTLYCTVLVLMVTAWKRTYPDSMFSSWTDGHHEVILRQHFKHAWLISICGRSQVCSVFSHFLKVSQVVSLLTMPVKESDAWTIIKLTQNALGFFFFTCMYIICGDCTDCKILHYCIFSNLIKTHWPTINLW